MLVHVDLSWNPHLVSGMCRETRSPDRTVATCTPHWPPAFRSHGGCLDGAFGSVESVGSVATHLAQCTCGLLNTETVELCAFPNARCLGTWAEPVALQCYAIGPTAQPSVIAATLWATAELTMKRYLACALQWHALTCITLKLSLLSWCSAILRPLAACILKYRRTTATVQVLPG